MAPRLSWYPYIKIAENNPGTMTMTCLLKSRKFGSITPRKVYFGQADGHVSPAGYRRLKLGGVSGRTAAQQEEMVNQEWVKRSAE